MRYAVILGGSVENIIEAEGDFTIPSRTLVEATDSTQIGGTYAAGVFYPPAPPAPPPIEELRATFPTLNPAQIRLGLLSIGITEDMVDPALVGDPSGMTEWKYRPSYQRLHPLVTALSTVFDLPPTQVDSLWLWAAQL